MKTSLLLACFLGLCLSAQADDFVKGRVRSEADKKPVAMASLTVEYPDTIVSYEADRKGRFKFRPLSFPFTVAVKGEGMAQAMFGLMSMPDKGLLFELAPDPNAPASPIRRRKPDWASNMPRRLSSTYIVRSSIPNLP